MQEIYSFLEHHWILTTAGLVFLSLLLILEILRLRTGGSHLTPTLLTDMINHKNAQVVDLRSHEDFSKGHIIGSLSLPIDEYKTNGKKLDKMKNRALVLVCAKGQDSHKLASELKAKGFQAYALQGGLQSWTGAEMPLTKQKS